MKLASEHFLPQFLVLARPQQPLPAREQWFAQARQCAQQLSPDAILELAQKAALLSVDSQAELTEAQIHDKFLRAEPAGDEVLQVWNKLQVQAGSSLPAPKVTSSSLVDLGAQAGNQVFLEAHALQSELSNPAQLTFVLAHEMGHVVHRDSVRRAGVNLAVDLFSAVRPGLGEARLQSSRRMELEADDFAAGVMQGMQCDSRAILSKLLSSSAGQEHPDGLARAEVVRGYLPVADETWADLLSHHSQARARSLAFDEDQAALAKMMARMV